MSNQFPIDEILSSNEDEESINDNDREILVDNTKNFTKIYYALKFGKSKKKNKSVETERKKEDLMSLIKSTIREKDYITQRKNSISKERKSSILNPPKKNIIMSMTDSKNSHRRQSKFMNPKTSILEFDFNYENNSNQKNDINKKELSNIKDENKNSISTIDKVVDSFNNISNLKSGLESSNKNSIYESQKNMIFNFNISSKKNSEKKNPSSLKKLINNTQKIKPNNKNKNNINNYDLKNYNNYNINIINNNKNKNITEIKNDNFLFIEENIINQNNEKLTIDDNNNMIVSESPFIKRSKEYEKKRQYHLDKMRAENFNKEMLNMKPKPHISRSSKYLCNKLNKKPLYEDNRVKDIKSGIKKFKTLFNVLEKNNLLYNRNNSANILHEKNISKRNNDFYYKEMMREKIKKRNIQQLKDNKTITKDESSRVPINKISQLINEGFNYNNLSVTQRLNDDSQIRHFLKPYLTKYFPILKKKELKKSSSVPKLNWRIFIDKNKKNKNKNKNKNKLPKKINNNRQIVTNRNLNKSDFDLYDKMNEERIHWSKKLSLLNKGRNKKIEELYKINIREDGAWNANTINELYFGIFNYRFVNSVIDDYNLLKNEE